MASPSETRFWNAVQAFAAPARTRSEAFVYVLDALSGWATAAQVLDIDDALRRIRHADMDPVEAQEDALLGVELARDACGTADEGARLKQALSRVLTAAALDPQVASQLEDAPAGPRHLFFIAYTLMDGQSACSAALEIGSPARSLTPDEQGLVFVRMLVQDLHPHTHSATNLMFLQHGEPMLHRTLDDVVRDVLMSGAS